MGPFFDTDDGDYCYKMSDNMLRDSEGNMMMIMSDNMAMDMDSGEIHFMSGSSGSLWDDDEE